MLRKLTSRKFLVAAAGIISGVTLICSGNVSEGVTAVIASVVSYLIAEGYIDSKAVKSALESTSEYKEEKFNTGFSAGEDKNEE